MMQIKQILALAAAQLGVKESPAGSNKVKYNAAYYGQEVSGAAYPWCCAFIWWLFRECGASALFFGGKKTAHCLTLFRFYQKNGQAVQSAQAGDLVFFDFGGTKRVDKIAHIGLVERVANDGSLVTIEGNTGVASDANGGCVMRRTRSTKLVAGLARPQYKTEEIEMTKEEFKGLFAVAMAEHEAAIAAEPASAWAKEDWDAATAAGTFDGTKPRAPLTREQAAVVLNRLAQGKEGAQ